MKIEFSSNAFITAGTLAQMCHGDIRGKGDANLPLRGICTDSREVEADVVFVALRGERTDGHAYIGVALERGCRVVICERYSEEIEAAGAVAVLVKDSEMALSLMANSYQNTLQAKTIAVTGSVGKTTTKDMIAAVLSVKYKTHRSAGNHNSVIGMPLSVMETADDTEVSVLEMGMSGFGEIERMSITAEPHIAVITNIGSSHMELLGSRENICRAKLEILCGLREGGHLILNGDEKLLADVSGKSYHTHYVSLSCGNAAFFAQNIRVGSDSTRFDIVWRGTVYEDMRIRVLGKHNVYAALYAFAVGVLCGMTPDEIREGLLRFVPEGMRQNRYVYEDITILEDCYNASPESMIAAIDVLADSVARTGGRAIAVLGDMLELGIESGALHRKVGAHLAERGIDRLFVLGHDGMQIAVGAEQKGMSRARIGKVAERNDVERLGNMLLHSLQAGDTVLLKASRAVGMERVIAFLKENYKRGETERDPL